MWLDPLLLSALALLAGATLAVSPLASALALLTVFAFVARRIGWGLRFGIAVCVAIGALRAAHVVAAFDAERARARDALGAPARCALWGSVDSSPSWVGGRASYLLSVTRADCDPGHVVAGTRVRLGGGPDDLARGDRVSVVAQIAPIELLFNADLNSPLPMAAQRGVVLSGSALSVEREARAHGVTALIDRARAFVRRRIQRTFAKPAEPMARALVLGENDLDPEDDAAFKKSGLSHMLAVSGTHLVFAVVALVKALTSLLVRIERLGANFDVARCAALVGALLSLGYADFAGGSGSAWRAAYMLSAIFVARALGRLPCASRALGLSLIVGWVRDGLVAFDISFLLSAAATSGLLLLKEPLFSPCKRLRSKPTRALAEAVCTTLSAMIPCAPLLALLGSDLTLAGIFANVLAAPLGETIALPLCLAHALASPWPLLETGIGLVASGALLVVKQIARESAAQRWLAIPIPDPSSFHLALAAVLGAAFVLAQLGAARKAHWLRVWLASSGFGLLVVELALRARGIPHGVLRMTALSVGQGDSTLVDFPDGSSMLIDAGGSADGVIDPGAKVVVPVLRARRRTRLDVIVLSHPHPDHFGGLLSVLRAVRVGEIWDTGQGAAEGAGPVYAEFLRVAAERHIPVRHPSELCGAARHFGRATLRVLGPCPDYTPGRGANDNSFVLRLELAQRAFLLTGDAQAEEEGELLASGATLAADVLKVGHHGSRTSSTPAFLESVKPHFATISCGVRNRFGHPVPEIVARIASRGVRVLRTDRDGSLSLTTDGAELRAFAAYPDLGTRFAWWLSSPWFSRSLTPQAAAHIFP